MRSSNASDSILIWAGLAESAGVDRTIWTRASALRTFPVDGELAPPDEDAEDVMFFSRELALDDERSSWVL